MQGYMTQYVSSAKSLGAYTLLQFIKGVALACYTSEGQDRLAI